MSGIPPNNTPSSTKPSVKVYTDPKNESKMIVVVVDSQGKKRQVTYVRLDENHFIDLTDAKYRKFAEDVEGLSALLKSLPPAPSKDSKDFKVRVINQVNDNVSFVNVKSSDGKTSAGNTALDEGTRANIQKMTESAQIIHKLMDRSATTEARFKPKATELYKMARKAAALVVVVLSAPIALLAIGVARTVHYIRRALNNDPTAQAMRAAIKNMREKAPIAKFKALRDAFITTEDVAKAQFDGMKASLSDRKTVNTQVSEKFLDIARAGLVSSGFTTANPVSSAKSGQYSLLEMPDDQSTKTPEQPLNALFELEKIRKKLNSIDDLGGRIKTWDDFEKLWYEVAADTHALVAVSKTELKEIFEETRLLTMDETTQKATLDRDLKLLNSFIDLNSKKTDPTDYRQRNREVVFTYRKLLESPTYLTFKNDPNNEFVRDVQKFAVDIYTLKGEENTYFDLYYELGKQALEGQPIDRMTPAEIIEAGMRTSQSGLYSADSKFKDFGEYRLMNLRLTRGSLASQGGFRADMAYILGAEPYDPHGALGNTPSLQGVTTMTLGDDVKEFKIYNSYSGSTTVGKKVSPEMLAMLQGMRNNKKASNNNPDVHMPGSYVLMNNQNINNTTGEGERSFALMQLGNKFPEEFMGVTLSKDSDLYLGKGRFANLRWKGIEGKNGFGAKYIRELSHPACYQMMGRKGNKEGQGMYLPGGKDLWVGTTEKPGILTHIMEEAQNTYADSFLPPGHPGLTSELEQEYRTTLQNFIYAQIRVYSETYTALQGGGNIISAEICKECKDRGGAAQVKLIHTRMSEENRAHKSNAMVGALIGRPVDVGNVPPLSKRVAPINTFIKYTGFDRFQEATKSFIFKVFGKEVEKHEFEPALSIKPPEVVVIPTSELSVEPTEEEQRTALITEILGVAERMRKEEVQEAAKNPGMSLVRDPAGEYNRLVKSRVPLENVVGEVMLSTENMSEGYIELPKIVEEDVVPQFRIDSPRGIRFQIDDRELYPLPQSLEEGEISKLRQLYRSLEEIRNQEGMNNNWYCALQAIVTQNTISDHSLKPRFAKVSLDNGIGLEDGVPMYVIDNPIDANGKDVHPVIHFRINRDLENKIQSVAVSFEIPYDAYRMRLGNNQREMVLVEENIATTKVSFNVELDEDGQVIVKDVVNELEGRLFPTEESKQAEKLEEAMSAHVEAVKDQTHQILKTAKWNNRSVIFEKLTDDTTIVSMQKIDGTVSEREIKFYEDDPSYSSGGRGHSGFTAVDDYHVDTVGWERLVQDVAEFDQIYSTPPGELMMSAGTYEGYTLNVYVKENTPVPEGRESFQGVVRLFKDGVQCGDIDVDKVKQSEPKWNESNDATVGIATGERTFWIKTKYLDRFIKKMKADENISIG